MPRQGYIPNDLEALRAFYFNLNTKAPGYQTSLQIPTSSITDLAAQTLAYNYLLDMKGLYSTYLQNINAQIRQIMFGPVTPLVIPFVVPPTPLTMPPAIKGGVIIQTRALSTRVKGHSNYSVGVGEDLGILGPEAAAPFGAPPDFKLIAMPGFNIRINWKKGQADGVIIQSMRGAEAEWTQIGVDTSSPFIDNRAPLVANTPENRHYRLMYMKNDNAVGLMSNPVSVLAVP